MKSIGVLCLAAFMLSGCVSTVIEEERPPRVMIAQNADGKVSIAWESEVGYAYTLYYQEGSGGDWIALRGAERLRGTGKTMNATDHVNPRKKARRYRVLPSKL